jgi:hypothetical protein
VRARGRRPRYEALGDRFVACLRLRSTRIATKVALRFAAPSMTTADVNVDAHRRVASRDR